MATRRADLSILRVLAVWASGLLAGVQVALYLFDLYDDGIADVRSAWIGVGFVAAGLGLAVWPYLRGRSEPSSRDAEPADPAT